MKYVISEEGKKEIENARKKNHDKQIDRRLRVLELRAEGKGLQEISELTGCHRSHVSNLMKKYSEEGLEAISTKHYKANRRNMSVEEEAAFLETYTKQAEQGHLIDIREMESEYGKRVGHAIGSGQIYRVLRRHGWRKIMPRSRHPQKASEEVIETSKKLTPKSKN